MHFTLCVMREYGYICVIEIYEVDLSRVRMKAVSPLDNSCKGGILDVVKYLLQKGNGDREDLARICRCCQF